MHIRLLLILLSSLTIAQAQIYTWVDDSGRTHYSDRPPQDRTADQLDFGEQPLSTIGESGLRPGEREWLQDIRQAREQKRLLQQMKAQNQPQPVNVVTVDQDSEPSRPVRYYDYSPPPAYPTYYQTPRNGISLQLNYGSSPYFYQRSRYDRNANDDSARHKPRSRFKPRPPRKFKASGIWPNKIRNF